MFGKQSTLVHFGITLIYPISEWMEFLVELLFRKKSDQKFGEVNLLVFHLLCLTGFRTEHFIDKGTRQGNCH